MTKELSQDEKDQIESYIYKAPPEIQSVMRKDIEFGYTLGLQSAEKRVSVLEDAIGAYCVHMEKHGKANGNGYYVLFKQLLSK